MKKRLRKKKQLGEFRLLSCTFTIRRKTPYGYEGFVDWLLGDCLPSHRCTGTASGAGEALEATVYLGNRFDDPEARREVLLAAVREHPEVASAEAGPVR